MNDEANKDKEPQPQKNNDALRAISFFSQLGVTVGATILVGVLLGKFLDSLLGTTPWLLLICSLLSVGAAFKALLNLTQD